jgi:enoyl-CoA hydratase/carnithine racemase
MKPDEGNQWGFYNRLCEVGAALDDALDLARQIVKGPNFAHMMTKTMLNQEWNVSLDAAIEMEAQSQAICMQTADFERAYNAFVNKEKPKFEGN